MYVYTIPVRLRIFFYMLQCTFEYRGQHTAKYLYAIVSSIYTTKCIIGISRCSLSLLNMRARIKGVGSSPLPP